VSPHCRREHSLLKEPHGEEWTTADSIFCFRQRAPGGRAGRTGALQCRLCAPWASPAANRRGSAARLAGHAGLVVCLRPRRTYSLLPTGAQRQCLGRSPGLGGRSSPSALGDSPCQPQRETAALTPFACLLACGEPFRFLVGCVEERKLFALGGNEEFTALPEVVQWGGSPENLKILLANSSEWKRTTANSPTTKLQWGNSSPD
jgi:hypothetical protein